MHVILKKWMGLQGSFSPVRNVDSCIEMYCCCSAQCAAMHYGKDTPLSARTACCSGKNSYSHNVVTKISLSSMENSYWKSREWESSYTLCFGWAQSWNKRPYTIICRGKKLSNVISSKQEFCASTELACCPKAGTYNSPASRYTIHRGGHLGSKMP